jgi:hypothetical protein
MMIGGSGIALGILYTQICHVAIPRQSALVLRRKKRPAAVASSCLFRPLTANPPLDPRTTRTSNDQYSAPAFLVYLPRSMIQSAHKNWEVGVSKNSFRILS